MKRLLRAAATGPIRLYQRFISPLKPPTCRFEPTCSHFAIEAIEVHGVVKGTLLSTWRILRCQPFTDPGLDPVPPPGSWRVRPTPYVRDPDVQEPAPRGEAQDDCPEP